MKVTTYADGHKQRVNISLVDITFEVPDVDRPVTGVLILPRDECNLCFGKRVLPLPCL